MVVFVILFLSDFMYDKRQLEYGKLLGYVCFYLSKLVMLWCVVSFINWFWQFVIILLVILTLKLLKYKIKGFDSK